MPSNASKPLRFLMDSEVFATIWANHVQHPTADNWRRFVLNCFERFTEVEHNVSTLNGDPDCEGWSNWTEEQQYQYLSERCYTKCMSIRAKFKKDTGKVLPMPEGYKERKGKKASKRVTSARIGEIFGLN